MKLLFNYSPIMIVMFAAGWPIEHMSATQMRTKTSTLTFAYQSEQDIFYLQSSDARLSIQQDTDTIVLETIQINRPLFKVDSLQLHHYFQKLADKRSPSWKNVFIDRTKKSTPILPNRSSSTSTLISIDLLSAIARLTAKKTLSEQVDDMWSSKERYIDEHFDADLVQKMTGLSGTALEEFVLEKRPSASDLSDTVMYELMKYIKAKHHEE